MPKKGKKGGGKQSRAGNDVPEYASDDERIYGNVDEPDPESRDYFYDEVDEFHAKREKILIDKGYQREDATRLSDEEEVMALDSEESDDDEIRNLKAQLRRVKQMQKKDELGSDIEDQEDEDDSEDGLPDSKAWGKKRKKYYGDDEIEMKDMDDEEAEAVLEEKEALKLQRQMAEQLDDQDFGFDIFKPAEKIEEASEKEEKIVKDLSKLSKREKLKLLQKESPEFMTLIDEFKDKLKEVQEKLYPLKELIEKKGLTGKAADYVHTKFRLNLNYCTNIVFYLMLKAKQTPVHNHPIIKRLLQYRNIMKQLEPLDMEIREEISDIVSRLEKGEDLEFGEKIEQPKKRKRDVSGKSSDKKKRLSDLVSDSGGEESDNMYEDFGEPHMKKKKDDGQYETKEEREALEYYQMMKGGKPGEAGEPEDQSGDTGNAEMGDNNFDEDGLDPDMKRAITYQIEKNKGLTAHKKKELRNPRVKHRVKFRKAKIRRKGQVRETRTEMNKYGGEISGIRAGIKRSRKLH